MSAAVLTAQIPVFAQHHGAIGLIRPKGVVNQASLSTIADALSHLNLSGRPMVVIDLAETVVLDGKALEWFVDRDDQFGALGGGVAIAHPNDLCNEIFRLTGMNQRLSVFHDLASALGSFAK